MISREGFAGTTMRMVAEEAGVSTGMLNHYFANRQDLLQQALVFVSERAQSRMRAAIEELPPGRERLIALLDSSLEEGQEVDETWRVWINAYGEAVRLADLRHTIESRLITWYELLDTALEGLVPPAENGAIPWSWRLDAILNGLTLQALTSEAALDSERIRDEVIRTLFGSVPGASAQSSPGQKRPAAQRRGAGAPAR